jgi:hypothetical protein
VSKKSYPNAMKAMVITIRRCEWLAGQALQVQGRSVQRRRIQPGIYAELALVGQIQLRLFGCYPGSSSRLEVEQMPSREGLASSSELQSDGQDEMETTRGRGSHACYVWQVPSWLFVG